MSELQEIALLVPGAFALMAARDTLLCKHHGEQYTPGHVWAEDKPIAICLDCFDAMVDQVGIDVREPNIADTYCSEGECVEVAGDNYCHACKHRYCTKHMYVAGHGGLCGSCMAENPSAAAPTIESLEDMPCAAGGACSYIGLFTCDLCHFLYCKEHMSSQTTGCCVICTGEMDEDAEN